MEKIDYELVKEVARLARMAVEEVDKLLRESQHCLVGRLLKVIKEQVEREQHLNEKVRELSRDNGGADIKGNVILGKRFVPQGQGSELSEEEMQEK